MKKITALLLVMFVSTASVASDRFSQKDKEFCQHTFVDNGTADGRRVEVCSKCDAFKTTAIDGSSFKASVTSSQYKAVLGGSASTAASQESKKQSSSSSELGSAYTTS